MDAVLSDFVQVLRNAGVGVSVAEHLDALKAVAALGVDDPLLLKAALAACLVKNPSDRPIFDACFHRFFRTIPDLAGPEALKAHSKTGPDELAPSTKRPLFANRAALAVSVAEAARSIRLPGAVPMLQRGLYVQAMLRRLEADHFHQDVDLLRSVGESAAKGHELEQARKNLVDVVRSFVEARVVFDGAERGETKKPSFGGAFFEPRGAVSGKNAASQGVSQKTRHHLPGGHHGPALRLDGGFGQGRHRVRHDPGR